MPDRNVFADRWPLPLHRRNVLRQCGGATAAVLLAGCFGDDGNQADDEDGDDPASDDGDDENGDGEENDEEENGEDGHPWDEAADEIIAGIEEPSFPDREFDVTEYGAVGDGETDASAAFAEAIADCTEAGGGRVVVPEGEYYHVGPIHLEDDVNLHVTEGATISFSTEPDDYLPTVRTWWEGNEALGRSPLVYARGKENIAITGGGTLDAQADDRSWWDLEDEEEDDARDLIVMNRDEVPVEDREFGEGTILRPPFVQPLDCERVLLEDVTFLDSPFWFIHLPRCEHVTVRNVTTDGQGPNNDGCNPEFAKNVLIEDCVFDNGDDNVALKAGRNADGRRVGVSTENVVVQDCEMRQGHGAIVAGSEMSGGVQNVYARRNTMNSPNLAWPIRIKSNSHRGGFVRDWYVWDNGIEDVDSDGQHVRINLRYQVHDVLPSPDEGGGDHPPEVENINLENVASIGDAPLFYLRGIDESPVRDVTIRESAFPRAPLGSWNANVEDVTLENVDTGVVPAETSTDLLDLTGPTPGLFGMTFEGVTDADDASLRDDHPYLEVAPAEPGTEYYVDRDYEIDALPEDLEGGTLIKGKNDDKQIRSHNAPDYVTFEAETDVSVYAVFHPGGEDDGWWPDWRADWDRVGTVAVTDPFVEDDFVAFSRDFDAGEVVLGPNDADTGSSASYFTIVTEQE